MKVYNKRTNSIPADAVYVGRPTIFGNPFQIGRDGTRHEVVVKFRNHLVSDSELLTKVKEELKNKDLVCWCSPEECHADVLMWFANH